MNKITKFWINAFVEATFYEIKLIKNFVISFLKYPKGCFLWDLEHTLPERETSTLCNLVSGPATQPRRHFNPCWMMCTVPCYTVRDQFDDACGAGTCNIAAPLGTHIWYFLIDSNMDSLTYLSSRTQFVKIGVVRSDTVPCDYGVPRGSVLGPILFAFHVSPVSCVVDKAGLKHHKLICKWLYVSFKSSEKHQSIHSTEQAAGAVRRWFITGRIKKVLLGEANYGERESASLYGGLEACPSGVQGPRFWSGVQGTKSPWSWRVFVFVS